MKLALDLFMINQLIQTFRCKRSGRLPHADKHPPSRELMQNRHNAQRTFVSWLVHNIDDALVVVAFLGCDTANIARQ
eukprot:1079683-Prorocentrum_lima.AAC.1